MGTRTWRRMAMAILAVIVVTSAACATDEVHGRYATTDRPYTVAQAGRTNQQQWGTDQPYEKTPQPRSNEPFEKTNQPRGGEQYGRTGQQQQWGTDQQQQYGRRTDQMGMQQMQDPQFVHATEIMGKEVQAQQGREGGEIQDIILDSSHKRAEYVLLDDDRTISWSDLTFRMGGDNGREVQSIQVRQGYTPHTLGNLGAMGRGMEDRVTGTLRDQNMRDQNMRTDTRTQDMRTTAQGARDQNLRDMTQDRRYQTQTQDARDMRTQDPNQYARDTGTWDQNQYSRDTQDMRYGQASAERNRLSHLIGLDLRARDDNEKNIGSVEDVIITSNDGRIVYGLASIDKGILYREKEVAIPWDALSMSSQEGYARVDVNFNQLEALAFRSGELPDISDRTYAQRVFGAFDQEPYYEVYGYGPTDTGADREKTWGKDSSYNKMYQKGEQTTIEGTVLSTGMYRPEGKSMEEGTRLRVRTEDGQVVVVHGGPKYFSSEQKMSLKVGDRVTIEGRKVTKDGTHMIMASSIKSGGKTWQLRDQQGNPMWKTDQDQMQPDRTGTDQERTWMQNRDQNQIQDQTQDRTRLQDQTTQERTRTQEQTQDRNRTY